MIRAAMIASFVALSVVLAGCDGKKSGTSASQQSNTGTVETTGPSDADAAQQIQARLEGAQWTFFDGKQYPCSDTFSIVSVKVTDKAVDGKSATVEAQITMASKKELGPNAMVEAGCFNENWSIPFAVGQQGTWKARYTFQLWQSGWRLS